MQLFSKTDIGRVRSTNQDAVDAFMLTDNAAFAIVCDGMGGANGGDIASATAVKCISEYVKKSYSEKMDNEKTAQLLRNAISSANLDVFSLAESDVSLKGMGTTVVAAVITENYAVICHVGDSRAYLINDGIIQLTTDHSIVQSLIESGELTLGEAKTHPEKNVITRALGVEENIFPDYCVVPLKPDDGILLCSDGLTNYVDTSDILSTFAENNTETAVDKLISAANSNGGGDNISIIIVTQNRG